MSLVLNPRGLKGFVKTIYSCVAVLTFGFYGSFCGTSSFNEEVV